MNTEQTTYRKLDKLLAKFMAAMNGAALAEGFTLATTTAKGRTVLEVTQNDAAGASRVLMRVEAQVARPAAPVPPAKREQLALALPMEAPAVEPPAVEPPAAPAAEAPAVEAPVVEAPVVEAPVVEAPAVDPLAPGQRIMRRGDAVFEHIGHGSKMWTIESIEGSLVGLSWWSERRTVARESIFLGPADLWRLASDAPAVVEAPAVNLYRNGITPAELVRLTPEAIAELEAIHATRLVFVNLSNNDHAWPLWWFETPFDGAMGEPVAKALHDWYARNNVAPLVRVATRGDDERVAVRAEAGHALTVAEAHRESPELVEAQKAQRKRRKAEQAEEKRAKAAPSTPPSTPPPSTPRTVRLWIATSEWDALDADTRAELEEPLGGVPVEWEGRAEHVTALVPADEVLRTLQGIADAYGVTMTEGDDAPPPKPSTKKPSTKKPPKPSTKKPSTKGSKARRA